MAKILRWTVRLNVDMEVSHWLYRASKLSKAMGIFVNVIQYLPKYILTTLYYTFPYP